MCLYILPWGGNLYMKMLKRLLALLLICGMVINNTAYVSAGESETNRQDTQKTVSPAEENEPDKDVKEAPTLEGDAAFTLQEEENVASEPQEGENDTSEPQERENDASELQDDEGGTEPEVRAPIDWTQNQEALLLEWRQVIWRQAGQDAVSVKNEDHRLDLSGMNPETIETLQFEAGFMFVRGAMGEPLQAGDIFRFTLPREYVILEDLTQPQEIYLCDNAEYDSGYTGANGGRKLGTYTAAGNTVTVTVTEEVENMPEGDLFGVMLLPAQLNKDSLGNESMTADLMLQNDRVTELTLPAAEQTAETAAPETEVRSEEAQGISAHLGAYSTETVEKEWIDNYAHGRPNLLTDQLLKVEYSTDNGGRWTSWTPGALGIDTPMSRWAEAGIASVEAAGVGFETYRLELPHLDGEKPISYRFSEREEQVKKSGYIPCEENGKLTNIITVSQTFHIVMNTGAAVKSAGDFKDKIYLTGKHTDGTVFRKSLADLGADVSAEEGTGEVTIRSLPQFTLDQEEIIWSLNMDDASAESDTGDAGDKYVVTYDNASSSNFGSVTDRCHVGGSLIVTLTGKTNYQATKHWLDDGTVQRPEAVLHLWRYSERGEANYATASMVKNPNPDRAENIWWALDSTKDEETVKTAVTDIAPEGLDKYDPEGYRYIYFSREELSGGGYTQQFGVYDSEDKEIKEDAGMLPGGMDKRAAGDTSVYNNGHISNLRTGTVAVEVTKRWEAASFQSQLEEVAVTFTLQQRDKSSTESDWRDTEQTAVMDGFYAERLTQTITEDMPAYDQRGMALAYRWIESGVTQGDFDTQFTRNEDGTAAFVLRQKDAGGEVQEVAYKSEAGADGIITNKIADRTDYTVEKIWNDDAGHSGGSVTVVLYRDNKRYAQYLLGADIKAQAPVENTDEAVKDEVTGETQSPWLMQFANLPKYDDTGHKYTYYAEEEAVAGYHAAYEYDIKNRKAVITNTPGAGGNIIRVRKDWVDDGDDTHRTPIKVKVYNKDNKEEVYAESVWLTEEHNWWQEVGVPEGVALEDCAMEELSTCEDSITDADQIPEGQIKVNGSYADTRHHMYQVKYGIDQERRMLTVTNRRIGLIDITVRKYWVDDNNSKGDRTADAKLKLTCLEYPDAVSDSTDNGTVTVGDAKDWPIQDKDGNPAGSRQSVRTENDADTAYSEYYFFHLPKYDETGKVVHYSVEELNGNQNEYSVNIQEVPYEVGDQHSSDKQQIQVTNKKSAVKPVKFYKLWKDQYSFENGTRPDIYLELYRTVTNAGGTEVIQPVETYIDRKWTRDQSKEDYLWTCDFGNLPKYDDNGKEIMYYAKEQSKVNTQIFDYQTDNQSVYDTVGTYTAEYGASGTANTVGTASDGSEVLLENGTFVNRVAKNITISGKKVWKNVPSGFPDADFPKLTIHVDQLKDTARVLPFGSESLPPLAGLPAEEKIFKDSAAVEIAETATLNRIPGSNQFSFEISADRSGAPIPKYDDNGALYLYEVRETVENEKQLDAVYEKFPGEVNNYIITNTYEIENDKNSGRLKAEKSWSGIDNTTVYQYPAADFKLYRQYVSNDSTLNTEAISAGGKNFQVTLPELVETKRLESGTAGTGVEFDKAKLRIFAPNGGLYYYFVEETVLNGYATEADGQQSQRSEYVSLSEAGTVTSVVFSNSYKNPQDQVTLTGSKTWDDYGDAFQTRPEAAHFAKALHMVRYAQAQSGAGGAPAIEEQKVTLQTDDAQAPGYFVWTKDDGDSWTYTISNLDRYAPNSMPWKYRITEEVPDGYTNEDNRVDSADGETLENGNITMPGLTNTNIKDVALEKVWEGDNRYGQRPASIELELWVKIGTGEWQTAETAFAAYSAPDTVKEQYGYTLKETDKTKHTWVHTFSRLPAFVSQNGSNTECFYQVVETKAGDYVIDKANSAFQVTDTGVTYPAAGPYAPSGSCTENKTTIRNDIHAEGTGYIKVSKTWKDSGDIYDTRPALDESKNTWKTDYVLYRKAGADGSWEQVQTSDGKYVILRLAGEHGENVKERQYGPFQKEDGQGRTYLYAAAEILPHGYEKTETISPQADGLPGTESGVTEGNIEIHTGEEVQTDKALSATATVNALNPTVDIEAQKVWEKADGTAYTALEGKTVTLELKRKTADGAQSFRHPLTVVLDGTADTEAAGNREAEAWKALYEKAPKYRYDEGVETEIAYTVEEVAVSGESTKPAVTEGFWSTVGETALGGAQYSVAVTNRQTAFILDKTDAGGTTINRDVTLGIYQESVTPSNKVAEWKRTADGGSVKESVAGVNHSSVESAAEQTGPAKITGLAQGSYILHEEEAPAGYELGADVAFTLGADGKLTGGKEVSEDGLTLSMRDTAISLKLKKQDQSKNEIDQEQLGYAEFEIQGAFADGSTSKAGITSASLHTLDGLWTAGETYTIKETKAPNGFIRTDKPVEFTVDSDGTLKVTAGGSGAAGTEDRETLIFRNDAIRISIKKTSINQMLLAGAKFALTDRGTDGEGGGALFDGTKEVVTGEDGTVTLTDNDASVVVYGHFYRLEETRAPEGYILADSHPEVTFEVLDSGKIRFEETDIVKGDGETEITFQNRPIGLTLKKTDSFSKELIGGAEFEITRDDTQSRTMTVSEGGTVQLVNTDADRFLVQGHSYTVTERRAPEGYELPEDAAAVFTVNENGTIQLGGAELSELPIENQRKTGSIYIQKTDSSSGGPLEGAEFALYKKGSMQTPVASTVTDKDGKAEIKGLLWDTYILKETKAPAGYILDHVLSTDGIELAVTSDSLTPVVTSLGAAEGTVENTKNCFTLKKTDEKGTALGGSEFTLKDVTDGRDISTELSGMTESITLSGVLSGGHTYEIQETKAPEGYQRAAGTVQFTMGTDGKIREIGSWNKTGYAVSGDGAGITLADAPTVFVLKKTAEDTRNPQMGVVFTITPESGSSFAGGGTSPITEVTDGSGQLTLKGRLAGGMSYHVEETSALTGYTYAESFTIQVDNDGNVKAGNSVISEENPYELTDSPIAVKIRKTDDRGKPVKGIRFSLQEEEQSAAISLISDENGSLNSEDEPASLGLNLNAGKKYTLTETAAEGSPYIELPGPICFKVEKNGTITLDSEGAAAELLKIDDDQRTLTVTNIRNELKILKAGPDNKALAGAVLGIYTEAGGEPGRLVTQNGKELTWISEGDVHQIKGLPAGVYWIKETGAPEGYVTAKPIRFSIDSKGAVTILNDEGDVNGTVITMTDEPVIGHVRLIKHSAAEKEEKTAVAGARFDLYRMIQAVPGENDILTAGNLITGDGGEWTSVESEVVRADDASKNLGDGLPAGRYYFREIYAPDEYQLDQDTAYFFEIKGAGKEVVVQPDVAETTAENDCYFRTLTIVKKDQVDASVLAGAEFTLTRVKDASGQPVEEQGTALTTDGDGRASFAVHRKGTYRLKELKAPQGYRLTHDREVTVTDESPEQILLRAEDTENTVTDERVPGTLKLFKKDGADETALSGVQFTLYKKNTEGNVFEKLWDFITGNQYKSVDSKSWSEEAIADGQLVIDNLEWGSYLIKETKALDGYVPSDTEYSFVIGRYNSEIVLEVDKGTIANAQTEITFYKTAKYNETCSDTRFEGAPDADAQRALAGAEFTVYSDSGCETEEQTAVSNAEGQVTFKKLPVGLHYIKETGAPDGYVPNETVYKAVIEENGQFTGLTLTDGAEVENNTVVNDVYRTDIVFTKVDEKDSSRVLPGSVYGLYKNSVKIAEAETGKNGVLTFAGVLMNTEYTVRELKAPEGSYVSEKPLKLTFTVNENGEILIESADTGGGTAEIDPETGEIIWKEPQVDVRFAKTDEKGNLLGGAELRIEDQEGNVVESWTSVLGETHQSYGVLASGCKYKLVETKAPEGYLIAEPVEFEVEAEPVAAEQEKVIEVTMVDKAAPAKITGTKHAAARTGDRAAAAGWFLWMSTAAAAAGVMYRRRRKKE